MLETFGWDVVHATTLTRFDAGLQASGSMPATFHADNQGEGITAEGTWASWTLVPGAPSNLLQLRCTVGTGTATLASGPVDLAGSTWTVEFGLVGDGTGRFQPAPSGDAAPRLATQEPPSGMGQDVYKLVQLFAGALPPEVVALGPVFGGVTSQASSSKTDLPWLAPTAVAFAYESFAAGDPRGGVCAFLAMTEGRPAAGQVSVDQRILDGAPAGSDSAFVIGPNLVVAEFLVPALTGLVQGSTPSDFSVDASGVIASNSKTMTMGTFLWGDGTSQIKPKIPANNLQLALDGSLLHLSMSDVSFPYPDAPGPFEIMVYLRGGQFLSFTFLLNSSGQLVMVPVTESFSYNVNVVPSEQQQIFQIGITVALQVFFAVLGGLADTLGDAVGAAADEAAEQEGAAITATIDDGAVATLVREGGVTEAEEEDAEAEAAESAGDAIENTDEPGYLDKFKGLLKEYKFKIWLKVLEKAVRTPVDKMTSSAVAAARNDYDDLPPLNPFAAAGVAPVEWPGKSAFEPTGGTLDNALVIWGSS